MVMEMSVVVEKARTLPKERIIRGKVRSWDQTVFLVGKAGPSEKEVLVYFGRKVPYRVVKLSKEHLPRTDKNGKKITWLSNFGVINKSNERFVAHVKYAILLPPPPKNKVYVYYEAGVLKDYVYPESLPPVAVLEFTTGDPGIGIRPKDEGIVPIQ